MLRRTNDNKPSFLHIYKWLLSYYRPYYWQLFYIILLSILVASGELVIPKTVNYFIENILGERDQRLFITLMSLLVGVSIVSLFALLARNRKEVYIRENVSFDLQASVLSRIRQLGFPFFEKHSVGHILSIVNTDVYQIQRLFSVNIPDMIKQIIMIVFSCSLALSVNFELSLVIVLCMSSYYFLSPAISKKFIQSSLTTNEKRKAFDKKIHETISLLPDLKINVSENWDKNHFFRKLDDFAISLRKTTFYSCVRFSFRLFCINFGIIAIMLVGYWMYQGHRMGIADIVTYILYYSLAMNAITQLITNINQQQLLLVQTQNIYDLHYRMDVSVKEPLEPVALDQVQGDILFRNVSFQYGEHIVVDQLNLHIHQGERIALVGKSGGGKSSILKLIGRFYDPQQGDIFIDGINIKDVKTSKLRSHIGFVFQDSFLFHTTIKENIRFGRPDATDEEVIYAAKEADAYDFIMRKPEGFKTMISERGRNLSSGQIQRICIARMILKNPSIVVLDEATSALDNQSENEIQLALERLFEGRTVICVAHRLATVRDFDRICFIDEGVIVEEGRYKDLIQKMGRFYELVEGVS